MIWDPWIHSINIENAEKEKRTGEAEIYQVVPNREFHFKNSSKTDLHNGFLFEVLKSDGWFIKRYIFPGFQKFDFPEQVLDC